MIILYIIKLYIFVLFIVFVAIFVWNLISQKIKNYIKKYVKSNLFFYILGILSFGSINAWIPIIGELKKEYNLDYYKITLFFYGRAIKPLLLPIQISLLGLDVTVFMNLYLLILIPIFAKIVDILSKEEY